MTLKKTIFAASLAASLMTTLARAEEIAFHYLPEPSFDAIVNDAVGAVAPSDAFAGLAECRILDARTIRPYSLEEAVAAVGPCLAAVSRRYGEGVSAMAGVVEAAPGKPPVMGLLIETGPAAVTSPMLRDLSHSLSLRNALLLGQPAKVSREAEALRSPVQEALDKCVVPMVVRAIDSSEDFLRFYGRCIRQSEPLKVQDIKPAPGRKLAVIILSAADEPTVRSLNGKVCVNTGCGPVEILVLAYPKAATPP